MLLFVASALLVPGIAFVRHALRGPRIGDAPHCRNCAFDLTGTLDAHARDPTNDAPRCPECGRPLTASRDVVKGARRRRPALAASGALLLLLSLASASLHVSSANPSWNASKPTWLLVLEATRMRGDVRDDAAAELLSRHRATPLTQSRLAALVPPALDAQADPATTWLASPWFHLLDAAFALGAVSELDERRYVTQAIGQLKIKAPAMALGAEPWEVRDVDVSPRPVRDPPVVPSARIGFAAYLEHVALDGVEVKLEEPPVRSRTAVWREYQATLSRGMSTLSGPAGQVAGAVAAPRPSPAFPRLVLTPGDHTITSRWRVEAFRLDPPGPVRYVRIPEENPAASWSWEGSHAVRAGQTASDVVKVVRPSDYPGTNPVIFSESEEVSSSIVVIPSNARGDRVCRYLLRCPVDRVSVEGAHVVGRLVLRTAEREWPLAGSFWKPGQEKFEPATAVIPPGLPPGAMPPATTYLDELPEAETVDLVIIPDIEEAARRGIVGPVWGEELVLKSIPLRVLGPTPEAAIFRSARPDKDNE